MWHFAIIYGRLTQFIQNWTCMIWGPVPLIILFFVLNNSKIILIPLQFSPILVQNKRIHFFFFSLCVCSVIRLWTHYNFFFQKPNEHYLKSSTIGIPLDSQADNLELSLFRAQRLWWQTTPTITADQTRRCYLTFFWLSFTDVASFKIETRLEQSSDLSLKVDLSVYGLTPQRLIESGFNS